MRQPAAVIDLQHTTVASLITAQRRRERVQFVVVLAGGLALTLAIALLGRSRGFTLVIALLVVAVLFALIARWPLVGLYTVAICALTLDWVPLKQHIGTDEIPIWAWPNGISSMPDRPIGVVLLFIVAVVLVQRLAQRQGGLRGGALLGPFLFFLTTIVIAVAHGLGTGGQLKTISMEIRPFEYLFLSYLLAYNLIAKREHVRLFFWLVIAGAALKSLQGVYLVLTLLQGHVTAGQNEIMGHEDSFFFVGLLLLIILFRLHHSYRPQLIAALLVMPPLLYSLVANNRRADYVALVAGVGVAWLLTIAARPDGRRARIIVLGVCLVLGTAYVVAFAHSSGWWASPAHAVMSTIHPSAADQRDQGSNMYRTIENYDLTFTERQSPLLGYGFGKAFLQPVPLADIKGLDPIYLFVPHNTIYWVFMRAGPLGFMGLWYLFGSIIVRGGVIARNLRDPYLQLVAIYAIALTVMEILVAYGDYQLFFFRNVIYLGLLAGMLMKLPQLDAQSAEEVPMVAAQSDRNDATPVSRVPSVQGGGIR